MASAAPSKGIEVPKPVPVYKLTSPSASGTAFLIDMLASPSASGKPVVFSIGGAEPRSSSDGVKGKDAAAADPRSKRDIPVPKIHTTADVLDGFPEDGMRDLLLAMAKDSGAASMTGLSSRGCWVSKEDGDVMQLKVDMPGLGKEHVKVRVEKDALVIKGEGDKGGYVKVPARYSYRIELPSSQAFKMDQIKAEMKNGVLVVTMPKIKGEERKDVYEIKVE